MSKKSIKASKSKSSDVESEPFNFLFGEADFISIQSHNQSGIGNGSTSRAVVYWTPLG